MDISGLKPSNANISLICGDMGAVNPATLRELNPSHSWSRAVPLEMDRFCWWILIILTALSWVVTTPASLFAAQKYYYIHVSSFRVKRNALKVERSLEEKGYPAVVSGEQVQSKGFWYRVYVGPISSLQQAKVQSSELKAKRLTKYTAIYEKYPIHDESAKKARVARKAVPMAAAGAGITARQLPQAAPSVGTKPPTTQPTKQKVEMAKKPPPTVQAREERQEPTYQRAEPASKVGKKAVKDTRKLQRRGDGQNISGGKLSLSFGNTYREVKTDLTSRSQITSDGTTTTEIDVAVPSDEKNDYETQMNLTMLRLGLGLTDFLEIFGDVGVCYDEFKDFKLAYGGGARLNLFEVRSGSLRGLYSALQAEYHKGKLKTDYQSVQGNKFSKKSDWWDFTAKGEIGYTRNRFAVYAGATYFIYREDTDRYQEENLPVGVTSLEYKDDLDEEYNFGGYGGVSLYLTPGLLLNVEGQLVSQNSIAAAIEYRF